MGMARQAPAAHYQRKFNISHHAIERLRDRVEDDMKSRPDEDLGNLLDEKLRQSQQQYTVRDPRAPEAVTVVYEISLRSGDYYAIVRDNVAVTVLDESMVKQNFGANWRPALNTPFANKLKGIQLAKPADKAREVMREMQTAPPAFKPTPVDEAILRGDLPPPEPPPSPPAPLEEAGIEYARALRRVRECEQAVERAKLEVEKSETALQGAHASRDAAFAKLNEIAGGDE